MNFSLRTKVFLIASIICFSLIGIALYVVVKLEQSAEEVVESSKTVTESAVQKLKSAGLHVIDSLNAASFFDKPSLTKSEFKHVDSLLARVTMSELSPFHGMEGGYYFIHLDEFLGYAFPTSPDPKPAFGPPPRSFAIIKEQALETIAQNKPLTRVHQFDPAKFPLVTEPVVLDGNIVGCVWTRVHIERLIPTFNLVDILMATAALFLLGFAVALLISWNMRRRIQEIRKGLQLLHTDNSFRFMEKRGVFNDITHSINAMIEARALELDRRKKLEQDLHQQDKMVTLGTLIAGVAHEVKTPLAVIKTRIQMWERKLRQFGSESDNVVTPESIELVTSEIDRLSDLVKKLLVFSKPVANSFRVTDLNALIVRTLSLLRLESEERRIAIREELDSSLPKINLDPQAMEQVFLNIMTNSIDAMQTGGTLKLRTGYFPMENIVSIEIEDTGAGIPEETLSQIFNPFFTTKENGTGLGLSISYEIVRAHKGTIEFINNNSHGTLCRIQLPIQ